MKIQLGEFQDGIAIIELIGSVTKTTVLQELSNVVTDQIAKGRTAFLLDLSKTKRVNMSALAALVELPAIFCRYKIAFSDLTPGVSRKLESTGVDRGLAVFRTRKDALQSADFQEHRLSRTRAIVFCDGLRHGFECLLPGVPPILLDALGEPVISRTLKQLSKSGVQSAILTIDQQDRETSTYFQAFPPLNQSIFYCRQKVDAGSALSLGATRRGQQLRQLQAANDAMQGDTIVTFGTDYCDLNFADMMLFHKEQCADLTFVSLGLRTPETNRAISRNHVDNLLSFSASKRFAHLYGDTEIEAGAFIISKNAAELICAFPTSATVTDLANVIVKNGGKVQFFEGVSNYHSCADPSGYFDALSQMLRGSKGAVAMCSDGERANRFVSEQANVDPGVELYGSCVVQDNARIGKNAVLENCIVLKNGFVEPGFWGQNLLIGPNGTLDHRFPNSSEATRFQSAISDVTWQIQNSKVSA